MVSPDGKHLVYATRYETKTALRARDLETNQERWLINNVTRDDQESRATRDTFPGYAFMPDGKSLIVPVDGKIKRVDFAPGQATVIPFSAKVDIDIAARLRFDYKVDDGPNVKARLIRYPAMSPDGKRVAFSAFNKIYIMDLPGGAPKRLTNSRSANSCPRGRPTDVTSLLSRGLAKAAISIARRRSWRSGGTVDHQGGVLHLPCLFP